MKYMMLIVSDPEAADRPSDPAVDKVEDWVAKHDGSGKRLTASGCARPSPPRRSAGAAASS